MDGTLTAGELSETRTANSARTLRFDLATPADDAALRALLRNTPMQGQMQLCFEREPSAFAADAIEGDFHQTIIAKTSDGRIVAMGGRSIRDAYINGQSVRMGYLGQLRIAPSHRGRDTLFRGYAFLRELHADGRTPFYLTSILTDNLPARRLLEANLRGMPTYHPLEEWLTFAIPTRSNPHNDFPQQATFSDIEAIEALLATQGPKTQFTPAWNQNDITGSPQTPALNIDDFILIKNDNEIKACAATWDQRTLKQVIVGGYTGRLKRWRWAINRLAYATGWPPLPKVGEQLSQAYLSHLAVAADDETTFRALITAAQFRAAEKGCDYVLVGLAARHPFANVLKRWKHRLITSILYAVHWEDGQAAVAALDGRLPHVEISTL